MQVLVIGANGNAGLHVVIRLAASEHKPIAMIQHADQRHRFDELGVPTVLGHLEYPINHVFGGCDAVIFAAGSGGKTVLVDHLGAIRAATKALGMMSNVLAYLAPSSPD